MRNASASEQYSSLGRECSDVVATAGANDEAPSRLRLLTGGDEWAQRHDIFAGTCPLLMIDAASERIHSSEHLLLL